MFGPPFCLLFSFSLHPPAAVTSLLAAFVVAAREQNSLHKVQPRGLLQWTPGARLFFSSSVKIILIWWRQKTIYFGLSAQYFHQAMALNCQ